MSYGKGKLHLNKVINYMQIILYNGICSFLRFYSYDYIDDILPPVLIKLQMLSFAIIIGIKIIFISMYLKITVLHYDILKNLLPNIYSVILKQSIST